MFSLANWQNPETLMLNITNALLGLFMVYLFGRILFHVVHDIVVHTGKKHIKH